MQRRNFDFLIIGGGIFGVTAATELLRRGHKVCLLNPGKIPHPLAASTDISKAVRMEYGSDERYMEMAIESIEGWRAWNDAFNEPLYHETGFLVLSRESLETNPESFAAASYVNLVRRGIPAQRLDSALLSAMYPVFDHQYYIDGFYNPVGGYAESGRVVRALADHARTMGAEFLEEKTVDMLMIDGHTVTGVRTREGDTFYAGHTLLCAGSMTPFLLPELQSVMRITGHPVFHLKPELPSPFMSPDFAVFAADISHSGWYGFPWHPHEHVVKIANHGTGIAVHPEHDERNVTKDQKEQMRAFVEKSIPSLASAELIRTRLCLYTDTLDGHFWIDRHPEIEGLSVSSGGSGHAFKMAPVLGDLIADTAEGKRHRWSERFLWRELDSGTVQEEEARYRE